MWFKYVNPMKVNQSKSIYKPQCLCLSVLMAAGILLSACKKVPEKSPEEPLEVSVSDEELLLKADEVTALLQKRLGSQLKTAMQSGGPVAGIQVCQQIGQSLTNSINEKLDGVLVTRTSLRIRNPKNAPTTADRQVMEGWLKQVADTGGGKLPQNEIVRRDDGSVVVYKPILTQQLCMKCHGEPATFTPELISLIKKHYPDDQATGFKEGSLRGVFKAIFPKN
jgi:hypothetical protein